MLAFHCPHCGQHITAEDESAGAEARCPACAQALQVPMAVSVPPPMPVSPAPPLPAPPPGLHYGSGLHPEPDAGTERVWMWQPVVAVVATAGISFLYARLKTQAMPPKAEEVVGSFVGSLLVASIIAVVAAAIMRKSSRRRFGASFVRVATIVMPVLAILGLIGNFSGNIVKKAGQTTREREQLESLQSDIRKDLQEFADTQGDLGTKPGAELPKAKGDPSTTAGKLRNMMNEYMSDMVASKTNYTRDLQEAGVGVLLSADRLEKDGDLKESREIIAKAREVVARYRAEQEGMVAGLPDRMERLDLGESKTAVVSGARKALSQQTNAAKRTWDLEVSIVDKWSEIIDLLESTRGHWQVREGTIVFEKGGAYPKFKELLAQIDEIAAEQEKVRDEVLSRAGVKMNAAKEPSLPPAAH